MGEGGNKGNVGWKMPLFPKFLDLQLIIMLYK